tara:strand:- start:3668 stop:3985 length:318 start_codon:yes stop_codon:yes gene_type:complete
MENSFEIINQRLIRIESLLENLSSNIKGGYPEIMSLQQLADYLDVSKSSIYKMTSSNKIPHSKRGKKLYFNKEEITYWALENKVLTQEELESKASLYSLKRRNRF